jgi:integrase
VGSTTTKGSIEGIFRRACLHAGVDGHFHMLRHTYAIVMLRILTYVNRERGLAGNVAGESGLRLRYNDGPTG